MSGILRQERLSVNGLLLSSLLGIAAGSIKVLREGDKIGQADALEERAVAVQESAKPIASADVDALLAEVEELRRSRVEDSEGYKALCAVFGLEPAPWATVMHAVGLLDGEKARLAKELEAANRAAAEAVNLANEEAARLKNDLQHAAEVEWELHTLLKSIGEAVGSNSREGILSQVLALVEERDALRVATDHVQPDPKETPVETTPAPSEPVEPTPKPEEPKPVDPAIGTGAHLARLSNDDAPAVLYANPPVPDHFPGRNRTPKFVPAAELLREPEAKPAPFQPKALPSADDGDTSGKKWMASYSPQQLVNALARLADNEGPTAVQKGTGIKNVMLVKSAATVHKAKIERLKLAAPEERPALLEAFLAEFMARPGAKEAGRG